VRGSFFLCFIALPGLVMKCTFVLLPPAGAFLSLRFIHFLTRRTALLVWTSALPRRFAFPLAVIPFMLVMFVMLHLMAWQNLKEKAHYLYAEFELRFTAGMVSFISLICIFVGESRSSGGGGCGVLLACFVLCWLGDTTVRC
jgi:hypothetical protein